MTQTQPGSKTGQSRGQDTCAQHFAQGLQAVEEAAGQVASGETAPSAGGAAGCVAGKASKAVQAEVTRRELHGRVSATAAVRDASPENSQGAAPAQAQYFALTHAAPTLPQALVLESTSRTCYAAIEAAALHRRGHPGPGRWEASEHLDEAGIGHGPGQLKTP